MSKFDELFGERIKENTQNSNHVVKTETQDEIEIQKIDRILVVGLLMILLLVPLVIHVHFGEFVSPQITGTDMDSGSKADIFTYYKYIILLIGTILLTIVFLYKVLFVGYKISGSKINIFTGLFAITIVLSAIFAPNKTLALFGMYNRHEGTLTYLCYITLFFIASNIKYSLKQLNAFIYILVPFILINTALGLFSFFGIDILQYDWGKKILFSGLSEGSNIQEGSKLISTINHGNYVSGISAVFIAIFGSLAVMAEKKRVKVVYILISTISFAMLLTAFASSGFVTLVFMIPLIIIGLIIVKDKKGLLASIGIMIILFTSVFIPMAKYEPRVWDETFGFFLKNNPFMEKQISFKDNTSDDSIISNFSIQNLFENKALAKEKFSYEFPQLPKAGVAAGTGRAYIWKETGKLIAARPLLGYGFDTFQYHFNQNDPQKYANLMDYNVIVDKPHNMYIGLAYSAGLISLVTFICILMFAFIRIIKQTKIGSLNIIYTISISFGVLAFSIQALFNDSIVGTGTLFWVLLGIMINKSNSEVDEI